MRLVSMEIRPLVRGSYFWPLVPDTNLATVRKLRRWASTISWTAVDLHRLSLSYRSIGAMGLPRDIIEEIVQLHRGDSKTLMACSLTCRALFSAVRGLVHESVRLSPWRNYPPHKLKDRVKEKVLSGWRPRTDSDWCEVHLRYLSMGGKRGLLGYTREVNIDIGYSFTPETLEVYLPHFRSFNGVHALRISCFDLAKFLPPFERYFAQFVPTLRSLSLPYTKAGTHEILEFICKFPHLDDLSLTLSYAHSIDVPPKLSVEHSPPLKGTLVLRGSAPISARFLLKFPGGLHFQSIDVGAVDKAELDEILAACSSNLETLSIRPRSRKFTQYYPPEIHFHWMILFVSQRRILRTCAEIRP